LLSVTSAFCTFGLIKGRLYESTCRLRDCQNDIFSKLCGRAHSYFHCFNVVKLLQHPLNSYTQEFMIVFMSATCMGSKIDFFAVLTILCSIE